MDNSSLFDSQNKTGDIFKENTENLTDSLEDSNKSDSEIYLNISNRETNTNDTIIIHNNKITFDDIIEMEDLKHYLSTSTNHNSQFTISIKNKINNYLNYMDYRGNLKNQKNLGKRIKITYNHDEAEGENNKIYETPKKQRKSISEINLTHRKILSNILTSKEYLKKSIKSKNEFISNTKTNTDLDKTICDLDCKHLIDEENYEDFDVWEKSNCDRDDNNCVVNKVKDFQEKYLKGGVKLKNNFDKKIRINLYEKINKKNKKVFSEGDTDKDEEKDSFDISVNVLTDENKFLIKNKNMNENNYKTFNKRLFNLKRNNNFFTFNPNKVTSKLTELKIISLIKYNLENKESGGGK